MIKVSVVSYLNSTPFVYGLNHATNLSDASISLDIPAVCAQKLLSNEAAIGLVPVAIIPLLKEHHILSDYCIGANGSVKSVMLYSNVELHKIKTVLLDYQSRTSVMLTKILAREFWKINPVWLNATENYINEIDNDTAGVVIGDRTFNLNGKYKYEYDLSAEWKKFTGLPFVFACWVSNTKLPDDFISRFNAAIKTGIDNMPVVIEEQQKTHPKINVDDYLKNCISFSFDNLKKQALQRFLGYLS